MVCHYWFFNYAFKCQDSFNSLVKNPVIVVMTCWSCFLILAILLLSAAVDYCCIIHGISKFEVIHLLKNSVLDDCGYI